MSRPNINVVNQAAGLDLASGLGMQNLVVGAAGVKLDVIGEEATHVFWTNDGDSIRIRFDADATATVGHEFFSGASGIWRVEFARRAHLIRSNNAGADSNFRVTPLSH